MSPADRFIWMNGWERFQTFQTKRGKLWTPPWIKVYSTLLENPDYLDLPPRRRSILVGLWLVFGRCPAGGRLVLGSSLAQIGRIIADDSVRKRDLDSLNHAGWIDFCSRTVLEQRWDTFWNSSGQEVEVRSREEKNLPVVPPIEHALVVVLEPRIEAAYLTLAAIDKGGYHEPKFTRKRFETLAAKHPTIDLLDAAEALADWEQHGNGEGKATKDGITRLRNWLDRAAPPKLAAVPNGPKFVDPYDRRFQPPPNPDFVDPFILPSQREGQG